MLKKIYSFINVEKTIFHIRILYYKGISLEKIKESMLKEMLEYNVTLMALQRESDKHAAKIQMKKVGITSRNM